MHHLKYYVMIYFDTDYNNGLHPQLLERLAETNDRRTIGYGFDEFTISAKEKIRQACQCPEADVFLLVGGTQTNSTVISALLHPVEGVVCADTGHINVHEAGAVEYTGHKVIALPNHDGKVVVEDLVKCLDDFDADPTADHCVRPGMVYISFPTEVGTLYSARELSSIYHTCQRHRIPLFVDGARLGYGLTSEASDVSLPFLANHCDVFYIGGTKIGALCGEAVVFTNRQAHKHFFSIQKQHGAVIAKGALIGLQFEALFTDDLYFKLSRHAIDMAMQMKQIFQEKGYQFYVDSPTNQQFIVLPDAEVERLSQHIQFTHFGQADKHHTICRFVTSWATTEEEINELKRLL